MKEGQNISALISLLPLRVFKVEFFFVRRFPGKHFRPQHTQNLHLSVRVLLFCKPAYHRACSLISWLPSAVWSFHNQHFIQICIFFSFCCSLILIHNLWHTTSSMSQQPAGERQKDLEASSDLKAFRLGKAEMICHLDRSKMLCTSSSSLVDESQ